MTFWIHRRPGLRIRRIRGGPHAKRVRPCDFGSATTFLPTADASHFAYAVFINSARPIPGHELQTTVSMALSSSSSSSEATPARNKRDDALRDSGVNSALITYNRPDCMSTVLVTSLRNVRLPRWLAHAVISPPRDASQTRGSTGRERV